MNWNLGDLLQAINPAGWGSHLANAPAEVANSAQWSGEPNPATAVTPGWDKSTLSTNGYYQPSYSQAAPATDTAPVDPYYEQLNKLRDLLGGMSKGGGVADYSGEVGAAYDPQLQMIDRIMANAKVVGKQNTAKTKDIYGGLKGQLQGAAKTQAGKSKAAAADSAASYTNMTAADEAAFAKSRDAAVAELHRLGQDQSIPGAIESLQQGHNQDLANIRGYQTGSADLMNQSVSADNAYSDKMANVVTDDLSADAQHQLNMQLTQTLNQLGIKKADLASQRGQAVAQAKIQAALANAQRAQSMQQAMFSGSVQLLNMGQQHADSMYARDVAAKQLAAQQALAGIKGNAESEAGTVLANVMGTGQEGDPLYDLIHRTSTSGVAKPPSFSELSPYIMQEVKNEYPNASDYEISQIVAALRAQLPR